MKQYFITLIFNVSLLIFPGFDITYFYYFIFVKFIYRFQSRYKKLKSEKSQFPIVKLCNA